MRIGQTIPRLITTRATASLFWSALAPVFAWADGPASGPAGVDPGLAARAVFQGPDFWWKRIEPRTVSASWLESILKALLSFIGRLVEAIWDLITKLLRSLFGIFTGTSSGGTAAVWLIIAAILAWAIWKLYPVIVRWLRDRQPAAATQGGGSWQALAEAADLFAQAVAACRNGHHADAIRLALLALIARLEKLGLLRYDTTRTNREYQMELRHTSDLAACFGQLARIHERVWYGRARAERAEAERAISLCESVIKREDLAPE